MVGKCPDWKGLSVMLGGLLVPDDPEEVVAMLLPLSLPLLLKPNAEWFKLPIKGFLKGLDGVGSTKKKTF